MNKSHRDMFYDCLQSSSAHGIGKILKEPYLIFKMIWATLFVGAVFFFSYHTSGLIQRWYEMPTSVEITINMKDQDLPDIFICPTNVLSKYDEILVNTTEMKKLRKRITENVMKINQDLDGKSKNEYFALSYFWKSIDLQNVFNYFGVKPTDLVVFMFTESKILTYTEIVPDYEYLSCIKLPLSSSLKVGEIKNIEIFFYLKQLYVHSDMRSHFIIEGVDFYNLDFLHFLRSKQLLRFHMVSKGEARTLSTSFINLKGGIQYFLKLSTNTFHKVNRPQNPCLNINGSNIFLKEFFNFLDPKHPFKILPSSICEITETQKLIYKKHKCNKKFSFLLNDMYKGKWCNDINLSSSEMDKILEICRGSVPCNTTSYNFEINSVDMSSLNKLKTYVGRLTELYSRLNATHKMSKALRLLNNDLKNSNISEMSGIIKDFVQVVIDFNGDKKLLYTEKLSYTTTNLLSDIGGIFGFYMGISLLTLCEILVLLCHFTKSLFKNNKEEEIDMGNETAETKDVRKTKMLPICLLEMQRILCKVLLKLYERQRLQVLNFV